MATALSLLNNVLRGLRRDVRDATSTTDAYHLMLIQFLNTAKESVEDRWDWEALRTTVTVTLSASTQTYTLSAAGPADTDVTDRSRLLYEKGGRFADSRGESSERSAGSQPQVFDTTDSSEYRLAELTWEQFERLINSDDGDTNERPQYFALRRTGSYQQLGVWPMPTGTRTLKMRFTIPQAVIPNTFMTSYSLSIPDRPVWTRALLMAVEERGENQGRPLAALEREAEDALYFAIERERSPIDNTSYPV